MDVELDYGDRTIVDDDNLVELTNQGHATYQASIPFKVTAHVPLSAGGAKTLKIHYFVDNPNNATLYGEFSVAPGEPFEKTLSVGPPAAIGGMVGVKAGLYEPNSVNPFVWDEKGENLIEFDIDIGGISGGLNIPVAPVQEFATGQGEQAVGQLLRAFFTPTLISETAQELSDNDPNPAHDRAYYEGILNTRVDGARDLFSGELNEVLEPGVESLLDSAQSKWAVKLGNNDPTKGGYEWFAGGIDEATQNVFQSMFPNGLTPQNAGDIIKLDFAPSGAFLTFVNDPQRGLKTKLQSFLETGSNFPLDDFKDFQILNRAALQLPFKFDGSGDPDGFVAVFFEDVTVEGPADFGIEAAIDLTKQLEINSIKIEKFKATGSVSPQGAEAGLQLELSVGPP